MMSIKTYSELSLLSTFEERYRYLQLNGNVGEETFGFERIFNQRFYRSREWKRVRNVIIIRDNGCDLGIPDRPIYGKIIIHHLNPITMDDILHNTELLMNPEYLVCTSHDTHNAIHYGDEELLISSIPIIRTKNDTCPWRQKRGGNQNE